MPFFTKKPIKIEAVQWTGNNLKEIILLVGLLLDSKGGKYPSFEQYEESVKRDGLRICTHEGIILANIGDWIIKGIKGELYPCKPDVFEATYDRT